MKFVFEANQLTIQLEGVEKIWALKRRIQIPHYAVSGIEYQAQLPSMQDYHGRLRYPGTAVPGLLLAGTYRHNASREFRYIKMRQPGVLVIACKAETLAYDRVCISCAPDVAQDVMDWWQEHK